MRQSNIDILHQTINLLGQLQKEDIDVYYIDLFCGAGGTSTGVELAEIDGKKAARVIMCVNHDENAIKSHAANHPFSIHFTEDIRTLDLTPLKNVLKKIRMMNPNAVIILWASLECTNFSKAKGGLSRDPDSRTLAEHLFRYIEELNPDYIQIENVEEFLTWGPVIIKEAKTKEGYLYCPCTRKKVKGKIYHLEPTYVPDPDKKCIYYNKWVEDIKAYNYKYDKRIMNAADFGAYTSRKRLFIQFVRPELPLVWPEPTHSKNGGGDLFSEKKKWKPVKDCLELDNEGKTIFDRDVDLVPATIDRVLQGCIQFVAGGKDNWAKRKSQILPTSEESLVFLSKCYSGHPESKNISVEGPCHTITGVDHHAKVSLNFISKYFSGNPESMVYDTENPCHTLRTKDSQSLITLNSFLSAYYGNGHNKPVGVPASTITQKDRLALVNPKFLCSYNYRDEAKPIDLPCPTVLTKDRFSLVSPNFLVNSYSSGGQIGDIENPCPAITKNPKSNVVKCFFIDQQFGNSKPKGLNNPLGALTQNPKYALASLEKWIMDTNFGNVGKGLNESCPTVTANRKWLYLVDATGANAQIIDVESLPSFIKIIGDKIIYEIYDTDHPVMRELKEFMAAYGIMDIKMRMLLIEELNRIMGFPEGYVLIGSKSDQKKFIGNAVEVKTSRSMCQTTTRAIREYKNAA